MAKTVLVVPGTGEQGRAVTKELLQQGHTVRILARNPSSATAEAARAAGALVHEADLSSVDTLAAALDGVDALFFSLPADHNEVAYASHVLEAAKAKNVQHLVYSSVARTGDHANFPGWNDDYPLAWYWKNKHEIEEMARAAGFPYLTILRPAFFYSNFNRPVADWMFPGLADKHELYVAFTPDTKLDFIDVQDIAAVAEAAIRSPSDFSGKELSLATESLTTAQMAEKLSIISGEKITARYMSDEEIKSQEQQGNLIIASQVWIRDVGYAVGADTVYPLIGRSTPMLEALNKEKLGW
ncbi:hypothetical protein FB567DRAFT_587070 [Paraphoma chrysanthemicola]|uniref:NmrA-like domain-containing protein n=1 Tax=Paraphoma chrysanthemicola TaxID=798071 RepID=A0A8K0RL11_9PLEO|nr:hypothetical protein FB567DRAFT_587070 [Paraphoma chrysanthemicola]